MVSDKSVALITGGNLGNKGAQSMTFIAVSEIKRRFPELVPIVISDADANPNTLQRLKRRKGRCDLELFDFRFEHSLPIAGFANIGIKDKRSYGLKQSVKNAILKSDYKKAAELYSTAALCIDVSGFSFGEKKGYSRCMSFLDKLEVLRRFEIPTYLMPQSFGPFEDFLNPRQMQVVKDRASVELSHVRIAFAREKDGYNSIKELCPDANATVSCDLVLQSKGIDFESVFRKVPERNGHLPAANTLTVGIIPNARTYDHGDELAIDALYDRIIELLLESGREVALIRHAAEDLAICNRIKQRFPDERRVQVYGEDRYSFEYDELFKRCEFLVASRFHSIVHAYKQGVPCVSLGWAIKYQELLALMGQDGLGYDVTSPRFDSEEVIASICRVMEERERLSQRIAEALARIQGQSSAFDLVEQDYRNLCG